MGVRYSKPHGVAQYAIFSKKQDFCIKNTGFMFHLLNFLS